MRGTGDQNNLHVSPTSTYVNYFDLFCVYRQGCVVIFLSYFLALLIKIGVAADTLIETLGMVMVFVNILLVLAVFWTSWFAFRHMVSDSDDEHTTSV